MRIPAKAISQSGVFDHPRSEAAERPTRGLGSSPDAHLLSFPAKRENIRGRLRGAYGDAPAWRSSSALKFVALAADGAIGMAREAIAISEVSIARERLAGR